MNNIIRRIEITGFRSLDSVRIVCDEVNVFTGLNDVGKSNILRALNLFFNEKTDLNVPISFSADYSKLSLAKAQTSAHQKQQIKIRVYFNAPPSFKSLQDEVLWIERVYDRFGQRSEKSSLDDSSKRASLTRLVNSVHFFYIPALKGANVLEYILGEIGKRNLMSSEDIVDLNKNVNNNIKDFAEILLGSSISIKTNFELPVLVQDFWQRLNVNTQFDEFQQLQAETLSSDKVDATKLREEAYQISLLARGEGLKSKYIPPLLKWIQEHESSKHFIWGIDEPENSLEFKKAQEVADLYFNSYSKSTQIFLTSHSLAFIFPQRQNENITIFRCVKTGHGDITIRRLDDLFAQQSKYEIAEELGALEIQKQVIDEWRKKESESRAIDAKFREITRPIIYVEGTLDKEYWDKMKQVFSIDSNSGFEIQPVGIVDSNGGEQGMGSGGLNNAWQHRHHSPSGKKVILFFDAECNKKVEQNGDVVCYCPDSIDGQIYQKGIEHLIDFPTTFNKGNYETIKINGDNKTYTPDKNKIREYLFSLDTSAQKLAFGRLHAIYQQLLKEYL